MPFIRPHIHDARLEGHSDGITNLPDLIEFNATHNAALTFGFQCQAKSLLPSRISYAQLQAAVENACSWLVSSRCTTRIACGLSKPVAILLSSDISIFIYMAALIRLGTPVICLSARLSSSAVFHVLEKTTPSTVLVSPELEKATQQAQRAKMVFVQPPTYVELLNGPSPVPPPKFSGHRREDCNALIFHTSGSTGLPKPVYHSHAFIMRFATCHNLLPPIDEQYPPNVSSLPLYHGFGLLAPMLALSIGLPFVLPPASTIPTARSTILALEFSKARSMLSVPSILEDMLRLPSNVGIDALRKLDFIAIGGAPMKETVAHALVSKGVKLLNHWGATEIGPMALIQIPPPNYDWRYLIPRTDIGLELVKTEDNTYRVVGRAPGWTEPFTVQDLLVQHPVFPDQYRILGRADDLIVLATGEKVRPAALEQAVGEHPAVQAAVGFGDGRDAMGLLVELVDDNHPPEDLWEYLAKGNEGMDKHGKVAKDMVLFTSATRKPFVRTDKGSIQTKATLNLFKDEINRLYNTNSVASASAPFVIKDVKLVIRGMVADVSGLEEYRSGQIDGADFFETGMDSVQAAQLRRRILGKLQSAPGSVANLEPDICFQYPTVDKLSDTVTAFLKGEPRETEGHSITAMNKMAEDFTERLAGLAELANGRSEAKQHGVSPQRKVVLLTGSTGSLGCFLLSRLLEDASVAKVICINRPKANDADPARQRQERLMNHRGAVVLGDDWRRVRIIEAEMQALDYTDTELLKVTHIVHNAWPVDFNRSLQSFESHIGTLVNLIKLALLSAQNNANPTRLMFMSSIAVVGQYHWPTSDESGPARGIPERPVDARSPTQLGYAQAKWVCEKMLEAANTLYGTSIRASSVRIGQMTGADGAGAWTETEHFPIIVRSSRMLGALPEIHGSLSWMPVNRAASVLVELLFSSRFREVYHLENPARQSWRDTLDALSSILELPMVPFDDWMVRVRESGSTPASKIAGFLEGDFMKLATGSVVLGTDEARADSATLETSSRLDKSHIEEYVAHWNKVDQGTPAQTCIP
ncbi:acetyl-CoA synthetase-like protein [Cylindrobasidium torrendii FP15055 ss-10]|uniref:Acetyl-CoA synthetase-like protein n=1 Tax=Cylindrobasidium torrendii FP15055 ss-10 TaxID=1314674 RepID=A0A0D7BBY5_9AGAR|nr:acetyl-CoA synthetase-like protein [Cylindrobasidium torrendii FP15055 ss-10]